MNASRPHPVSENESRSDPPGKLKLATALRTLMIDKDFNSITTAEIAKTAKTNEALIYRYFGDKRGLLHYVLTEYMKEMQANLDALLESEKSALDKLIKMIWHSFYMYNNNRVFAKIILIEVRNYPKYFESEAYDVIKVYTQLMSRLIEAAQSDGDIRADVPMAQIRNAIIGAIEHLALPGVIFGRQFSPNVLTDTLVEIMLHGISAKR